jgi:hypothetical protein
MVATNALALPPALVSLDFLVVGPTATKVLTSILQKLPPLHHHYAQAVTSINCFVNNFCGL